MPAAVKSRRSTIFCGEIALWPRAAFPSYPFPPIMLAYPLHRISGLGAVILFAAVTVAPAADPVAEMASFSIFKNVDLNKLADGKPLIQRGPTMAFSRGLEIEC